MMRRGIMLGILNVDVIYNAREVPGHIWISTIENYKTHIISSKYFDYVASQTENYEG
jgi:hypothetical protein